MEENGKGRWSTSKITSEEWDRRRQLLEGYGLMGLTDKEITAKSGLTRGQIGAIRFHFAQPVRGEGGPLGITDVRKRRVGPRRD